jgi:serine/threonine-protein kinase RsbW
MGKDKEERAIHADILIRGEPCELSKVRDEVRVMSESVGFSEHESGQIMLAVDEALTNVIRHGYGGPCDKPISVKIDEKTDDGCRVLTFVIRDFGRQVDPTLIWGRDLEDVRPGGLGVHIIRTVMDEVEYSAVEGGGMLLVMSKRLEPA